MTSRSNGTATSDAMQPQFGNDNEPSYESKLLGVFMCLLFEIKNSASNCKILPLNCLFILSVLTRLYTYTYDTRIETL